MSDKIYQIISHLTNHQIHAYAVDPNLILRCQVIG